MHMLYESLVGQCEYTAQPKGSFCCYVIDTKGAILLVMLFWLRHMKNKGVRQSHALSQNSEAIEV